MPVATPVFAVDPEAATRSLRRMAASNLGFSTDQVLLGSKEEFAALNAADQVALTDEMSRIIVAYPTGWPQAVVDDAKIRVNEPHFGTPLADSSFTDNLVTQVANGQFELSALGGAASYIKNIGLLVGAGLLIYLYIESEKKKKSAA